MKIQDRLFEELEDGDELLDLLSAMFDLAFDKATDVYMLQAEKDEHAGKFYAMIDMINNLTEERSNGHR